MTTPQTFSLRGLIREVLANVDSEDLDVITKEVLRRIPADATGDALADALPPFIHVIIRNAGWHAQKTALREQRSQKVSGIRDMWQRHLDEVRYTIRDGSLRRLGDLTRDDVLFLAGELARQAAEKKTRAMGMKAVAAAMSEHDVKVVRDLPDDYLREMFGGKAA
ncbi:MAG TPA: hypothetical protein VIX86_17195 [Streptosporangiaceae bacterium]